MKVALVEPIVVSVPYRHREVSSIVARDGVTDVLVRITTDDGLVGWSEFLENFGAEGLSTVIQRLGERLIGMDPRAVERITAFLHGLTRQTPYGVNQQAIAAIENALVDIKAKSLNIPVYELLGGPIRDRLRLYWSHCLPFPLDDVFERIGARHRTVWVSQCKRASQAIAGRRFRQRRQPGLEADAALQMSADRQGGECGAVVRKIAADDLPALRPAGRDVVLPGEPDRRIHRFGSAAGEDDACELAGEPMLTQSFDQADPALRRKRWHNIGRLGRAADEGFRNLLPSMPDVDHDRPARGVQNTLAAGGDQIRAFGALDDQRCRAGATDERINLRAFGIHGAMQAQMPIVEHRGLTPFGEISGEYSSNRSPLRRPIWRRIEGHRLGRAGQSPSMSRSQ